MGYSDKDRKIDFADMNAMRHGDSDAFRRIVERYKHWAFEVAYGFVADEMIAYDISQLAFLRVWKNIRKWDKKRGFRSWFYTIIRNLCLNNRRDASRRREEEISPSMEAKVESPDGNLILQETRKMVWWALDKLVPEHREIIVLVDFRDMKYKDAAELLGIPLGTVMSRLYHARKKLAEILRPFWKGEL